MEEVLNAFKSLELAPPRIDKKSPNLTHALERAVFDGVKGVLAVVSKLACRNYDNNHPERIVCILIKIQVATASKAPSPVHVVVNNRQIDYVSSIRRWFYDEDVIKECPICYNETNDFVYCSSCSSVTCKTCHDLLIVKNSHNDSHKFKCPICRQWSLFGNGYGTPLDQLATRQGQTHLSVTSVNDFVDNVLAYLDGHVAIHVELDYDFNMKPIASFTRLSKTTRVIGTKAREIRQTLCQLLSTCNKQQRHRSIIYLYIFRDTYLIQEKPVVEISLFELTIDRLIQHGKHSIDGMRFNQLQVVYKPVEHIQCQPNKFLHKSVNKILNTTRTFILGSGRPTTKWMTWDNDTRYNKSSRHPDMISRYISSGTRGSRTIYLFSFRASWRYVDGFDFYQVYDEHISTCVELASDTDGVVIIKKEFTLPSQIMPIVRKIMDTSSLSNFIYD